MGSGSLSTESLLDRTWADVGAQEAPNGSQKGTQDEPKTNPTRHQFRDWFFARFWIDFGQIFGRFWADVGRFCGDF